MTTQRNAIDVIEQLQKVVKDQEFLDALQWTWDDLCYAAPELHWQKCAVIVMHQLNRMHHIEPKPEWWDEAVGIWMGTTP